MKLHRHPLPGYKRSQKFVSKHQPSSLSHFFLPAITKKRCRDIKIQEENVQVLRVKLRVKYVIKKFGNFIAVGFVK